MYIKIFYFLINAMAAGSKLFVKKYFRVVWQDIFLIRDM